MPWKEKTLCIKFTPGGTPLNVMELNQRLIWSHVHTKTSQVCRLLDQQEYFMEAKNILWKNILWKPRIFYGSQEQLMRKRQWFFWEEMSYVLFSSLLRVNNIICFFNRIKILEVITNRKIWNKLNSVFEKNASKV